MAGVDQTLFDAMNASVGAGDASLAGEFVIIADIGRWNVGTQASDPWYVATAEWATTPTDTPANQDYWARLVSPRFAQKVLDCGDYRQTTGAILSKLFILNIDGEVDDEVDPATYSLKGQTVQLRGGLRSWSLSQFVDMPGGYNRILDLVENEDNVEITLEPLQERPDRPIQQNRFGGFGDAYDFGGTAHWDMGDVCNLGERSATIQIRFKYPNNAGVGILSNKRTGTGASAGNPGFQLFADGSEQLTLRLDDGTNFLSTNIGSAGEYDDDAWHMATVLIDRDSDELTVYIDKTKEVDAADISSITGSLSSSESFILGASSTIASFWSDNLDESRVWYRLLSEREVFGNYNKAVNAGALGLVMCHRMDDDAGANAITGPNQVMYGFSGTNNISFGTSAGDPGSGDFTLGCWMRTSSPTTLQNIFGRRTNGNATSTGFNLLLNASGQLRSEVCDGTTELSAAISTEQADDDRFYGVAMVVDRTADTMTVYLLEYPRAESFLGTASADISSHGTSTYGGGAVNLKAGEYDDGSSNLSGAADWFFYLPLALTADEVKKALSEQMTVRYTDYATPPPEADKTWIGTANAHFWPADENTGTTINDRIGATNGTASSGLTWRDRDAVITPGASGGFVATNDGELEDKGKTRPLPFGEPQRIRPNWIDRSRRKLAISDGTNAPESVEEVMGGNNLLTLTTDYTVQLADGTITLQKAIDGVITAIVRGIQSGGRTLKYPAEIIEWVWLNVAKIPSGEIDSASITAYDLEFPYEVAEYLDEREMSWDKFHQRLLRPRGFVYRTLENKLAIGIHKDPDDIVTSVLTLDETNVASVRSVPVPPPTFHPRLGHDRTHSLTDSIVTGATDTRKDRSEREWRYVSDEEEDIQTDTAGAVPRTLKTPFRKRPDTALALASTQKVFRLRRRAWEVTQTADFMAASLGDRVNFTYPRHNISGAHQVVGHEYGIERGRPLSILTLIGR